MLNLRTRPVLLIESEPLIAMDVEAMLRTAGFGQITHVVSTAEALVTLDRDAPTLVILDPMVGDGMAMSVADRLQATGIPFIVYSGLTRGEMPDIHVFDYVPWLSKPCPEPDLLGAVETVLGLSY